MLACRIEGNSTPLGAPRDWDPAKHGHCSALFVRVDESEGLRFMRSAWEPTANELAAMLGGAKVNLGINAPQHPVIQLGVGPTPEFEPFFTVMPKITPDGRRTMRMTLWTNGGSAYADGSLDSMHLPALMSIMTEATTALARESGWL